MTNSNVPAPLMLVDCRPETEEVLKAVFEPRGVVVSRLIEGRRHASDPWLVIRGDDIRQRGGYVQLLERETRSDSEQAPAGCHELRLPPLFHYGDLIRSVERLLSERAAA